MGDAFDDALERLLLRAEEASDMGSPRTYEWADAHPGGCERPFRQGSDNFFDGFGVPR